MKLVRQTKRMFWSLFINILNFLFPCIKTKCLCNNYQKKFFFLAFILLTLWDTFQSLVEVSFLNILFRTLFLYLWTLQKYLEKESTMYVFPTNTVLPLKWVFLSLTCGSFMICGQIYHVFSMPTLSLENTLLPQHVWPALWLCLPIMSWVTFQMRIDHKKTIHSLALPISFP